MFWRWKKAKKRKQNNKLSKKNVVLQFWNLICWFNSYTYSRSRSHTRTSTISRKQENLLQSHWWRRWRWSRIDPSESTLYTIKTMDNYDFIFQMLFFEITVYLRLPSYQTSCWGLIFCTTRLQYYSKIHTLSEENQKEKQELKKCDPLLSVYNTLCCVCVTCICHAWLMKIFQNQITHDFLSFLWYRRATLYHNKMFDSWDIQCVHRITATERPHSSIVVAIMPKSSAVACCLRVCVWVWLCVAC